MSYVRIALMHNALVSTALIQFDCFPQRFRDKEKGTGATHVVVGRINSHDTSLFVWAAIRKDAQFVWLLM